MGSVVVGKTKGRCVGVDGCGCGMNRERKRKGFFVLFIFFL